MLSEGVIAFNETFVPIARSNGPEKAVARQWARGLPKKQSWRPDSHAAVRAAHRFFSGRVSVDFGLIGKN